MEDFVIIYVILILLFVGYIYNQNSELTRVTSSVDGNSYLVRELPDKQQAADLIASVRKKLVKLASYLEKNKPDDPRIQRLTRNFNPDAISESTPDSTYTSYSVNKGEKIVFCLRSRDENQKLAEENLLMFVALHELGHVITESVGHTQEFWDNFKYLLQEAISLGVYTKEDFKKNPREYCGTQITDSPLP